MVPTDSKVSLTATYPARPPYQRNDAVGWINRAAKPETQQQRLAQVIDERAAGDRYMNMAYKAKQAGG